MGHFANTNVNASVWLSVRFVLRHSVDMDVMLRTGNQIAGMLRKIDGKEDIKIEQVGSLPMNTVNGNSLFIALLLTLLIGVAQRASALPPRSYPITGIIQKVDIHPNPASNLV
jgi:hypothetical protein